MAQESLESFLQLLELESYKPSKLKLREVLNIGSEICRTISLNSQENVPWYFLQKLIGLIGTARNFNFQEEDNLKDDQDLDFDDFLGNDNHSSSNSINPLDIVCALLHCSDMFLQQEILRKMSMCQFAVPLILPPSATSKDCILLLWAVRDIVKTWRPKNLTQKKGFIEKNLVHLPLTTFSFVRLGECTSSKSQTLNQILSPEELPHDFFVHRNMSGGNVQRKISDGLVEVSWYFPAGGESDLFSDPIAVVNLRGDLQHHKKQFTFLTKVSTKTFLFIENTNVSNHHFEDINVSDKNIFFIINLKTSEITDSSFKTFLEKLSKAKNGNFLFILRKDTIGKSNSDYLKTLFPDLQGKVLVQSQDRQLAKKLQLLIKHYMPESKSTIEDFFPIACDLGMNIDENCTECKKPKTLAYEIVCDIKDLKDYKKETFKLQGHYWKELAKNEKELCRMTNQGSKHGQEYKLGINKEIQELRRQQYQQKVPDGMKKFVSAFTQLSQDEILFFLKWLKFYLASVPVNNKAKPQPEKGKDQNISEEQVGVEHFLRELGQLYEAECFMEKKGVINKSLTKFQKLPGIVADLLLNGYPLELIDGDASNIPLQWLTDVMGELEEKMQGKCKMKVISVLGVQSSGKSTLLNTMFGLQFPVASGRCTRGAFMTLLKVEDNLQEQLGCHCILIIDTEGLKAPELASLDESSEHDNELATLVVGLSDITIINLSMENIVEMKEILQVVVHAFLRMKHIGKKPNCQFVHQNVGDVSAHDKIMREKKLLMEQLDEMARIAGEMEKKMDIKKFTDIIDHDVEEHSWYLPSLWHGVPPMASISSGYSENVLKFKMYLLDFLKQKAYDDSNNFTEFVEWIKSLWNGIKHEKFIFAFRSTLVADAYNKLCIAYSVMEWNFRKEANMWRIKAENEIKNTTTGEICKIPKSLTDEMQQMLQEQERKIIKSLENHFDGGNKHAKLVEKYKEDFFRSASLLKNELEYFLNDKCKEVIQIQSGKNKIKAIQGTFHEKIAEAASSLLNKYRHAEQKLSEKDLESEFEAMWNNTLQTLNLFHLKKLNIGELMLEHLRRDMKTKASYINEKLIKTNNLEKYCKTEFKINDQHLEGTKFEARRKMFSCQLQTEAKAIAGKVLDRCYRHATKIAATKEDYNETFCQQLLEMICESLRQKDVQKHNFKPLFELDLKLLALGKAAPMFQEMHENFIKHNDPKLCLEKLKSNYSDAFKRVTKEKDDYKIRAQEFCNMCLKPAMSDYVLSNLGNNIVDDILTSEDSIKYGSRTFFQTALLKDLLTEDSFEKYAIYCLQYEIFVKDWITQYITTRYKTSGNLKHLISSSLKAINIKVTKALEQHSLLKHTEFSKGLNEFCKILKNDLVLPQDYLKVITFENQANVSQFFQYVKSFLDDTASQIENELNSSDFKDLLGKFTVQPQDELFRKVFGCGQQCPFCKVPCEAGGADHKEHFSSIHRPQGLGTFRYSETNILSHELCSTDVVSNAKFECPETKWKLHPYKEYREIFPNWNIQPDPSIEASVYWKYIFKEFNEEFAELYDALPAELPEDWYAITKERAFGSLQK